MGFIWQADYSAGQICTEMGLDAARTALVHHNRLIADDYAEFRPTFSLRGDKEDGA